MLIDDLRAALPPDRLITDADVMAGYVLGLQIVTGTGELVRLGRRTTKGVAGYDLARLMVGSEGTLGIIRGGGRIPATCTRC